MKKNKTSRTTSKTVKPIATKEQLYMQVCGNLVVMRKLPPDGVSMLDAIRGEFRLADQVVAHLPDPDQLGAWIKDAGVANPNQRLPKTDEVWLVAHKGGVLPMKVGFLPFATGFVSELSDTEQADQKVMTTYLNERRGTHMGVCRIDGGVEDLVAVENPGVDQRIEWLIEHCSTGATPTPDEVKIVEWQNGLYPFSIGDFYTKTVLPQAFNVPVGDAVKVAEELAAT